MRKKQKPKEVLKEKNKLKTLTLKSADSFSEDEAVNPDKEPGLNDTITTAPSSLNNGSDNEPGLNDVG